MRVTDTTEVEGGGQTALLLCFLLGRTGGQLLVSALLSARQAALREGEKVSSDKPCSFSNHMHNYFELYFLHGLCKWILW